MKSRYAFFAFILFVVLFGLQLGQALSYSEPAWHLAGSGTAVAPQDQAPSWLNQLVASHGTAGHANSIAVDSSGHPHISYSSFEGLKYAQWTGATWVTQTVDTLAPGYHNALALDSAGLPHIAYFGLTASGMGLLNYARWTGSEWQIESIDSLIHSGEISLIIDASGQPHISYFEGGDGSGGNADLGLKYAHRTGNGWEIQIIDSDGIWSSSLALDSGGNPHIAYLDHLNNDLKYAHRAGSTWIIQVVDSQGEVGAYTSLKLDAADQPHISYQEITNRNLKYASRTGTGWDIETIGSGGWFASMTLDASGQIHIIHATDVVFANQGTLKHTYRGGDAWLTEIVEGAVDPSRETSVVASDDGRLHVSYFNEWPNFDLWYARTLPLLALEKEASPLENVPVGEPLTFTLTLTGSDAPVELLDPLPGHVAYLTGTLTPPAVYSPSLHAVLWQGVLTDTGQVFQYQVMPTVGQTGDPALSIPIVNSAWLTDTLYNRAAFDMVIVNGWRLSLPVMINQID